jgi:hypothetical protein
MNAQCHSRDGAPAPATRQRGQAALLLSLSIVVAVSAISVGVAEVVIREARRVANLSRVLEAEAVAEGALDRAALWLQLNLHRIRSTGPGGWMETGRERWHPCDDRVPAAPCSAGDNRDQETFDSRWSHYTLPIDLFTPTEPGAGSTATQIVARAEHAGSAMPAFSTLHLIAEGRSRDGSGHARVRRSFQLLPLIARIPDVPVTVSEPATGNALTQVFGAAAADLDALRTSSEVHDDCTSLGPRSQGLVWITGTSCVLPSATTVGTPEAPVVLVVERGLLQMEALVEVHGMLVLPRTGDDATDSPDTSQASLVHGALIANREIAWVPGGLSVQYDPELLQRLAQQPSRLVEVPGSWTDHR